MEEWLFAWIFWKVVALIVMGFAALVGWLWTKNPLFGMIPLIILAAACCGAFDKDRIGDTLRLR
jgi:hypothetical protein